MPWARTWMAVAAAATVIGLAYMVVPYTRATLVFEDGHEVAVKCAPPIRGAFGHDHWPKDLPRENSLKRDCPRQARRRLTTGAGVALVGMVGFALVRRIDQGRRGEDLFSLVRRSSSRGPSVDPDG